MHKKTSLIVTSIASPNAVLKALASRSASLDIPFIVIGDSKSPADFALNGCDFYSLERQSRLDFGFAKKCPTKHYSRKNIGYLIAIQNGTELIVETDDDNFPYDSFWEARNPNPTAKLVTDRGWLNVYSYFTEENIWPRGLPLDAVRTKVPTPESLIETAVDAPIQNGLANENPDVDAIYRLTLPLPLNFKPGIKIALGEGVWCPFNSQNTTFWPKAFPLLYLPSFCSFRMTDIWRSFVAQRICWANGWSVLFESPTVWQDRNDHSLMKDFEDEIPGYLHNRRICDLLDSLTLKSGVEFLGQNLLVCYESLVKNSYVGEGEIDLIEAWIADLHQITGSATVSSEAYATE